MTVVYIISEGRIKMSEKTQRDEYGKYDDFSAQPNLSGEFGQEVTDEVVRYYSPMIWRLALTKTKSTHDAEDIFQEVFMKLVMNQKPFASEEHRKAWLIRVTINCANSHFVAPWRKNVDTLEDAILDQIADEDTVDAIDVDTPDVYSKVLALPENMREVILLFYYEELSIREISEILGTSEVNVKKRLSRARQKLRMELE